MPSEEEIIAAGGKFKAGARKVGGALKRFATEHPRITWSIVSFVAGFVAGKVF